MRLGIDASNLRRGGGITHLRELLRAANPPEHGFSRVVLWGGKTSLDSVEDRGWLVKCHQPMLDRGLVHRAHWQALAVSRLAHQQSCNLLFTPGGASGGRFQPLVTMSRNLLPFERRERSRYGFSITGFRLALLQRLQRRTFERAQGLIFLTRYARDRVLTELRTNGQKVAVIPHGVAERFLREPREQRSISDYSASQPFEILYVSIVDLYKHQWHVAEAVAQLRQSGLPVRLRLVGPAYPPALERLQKTISQIDQPGEYVIYEGAVPHVELDAVYAGADLAVFASSCENMPNILLEAMASGLPVACSNKGPMPEVLGDGGLYFDPEDSRDIASALRKLIESPQLRATQARTSFGRAKSYSWRRCADETFQFLSEVARAHRPEHSE